MHGHVNLKFDIQRTIKPVLGYSHL